MEEYQVVHANVRIFYTNQGSRQPPPEMVELSPEPDV
jgi:hypothetical protein